MSRSNYRESEESNHDYDGSESMLLSGCLGTFLGITTVAASGLASIVTGDTEYVDTGLLLGGGLAIGTPMFTALYGMADRDK